MAVTAEARGKFIAVDAGDRRLAGGIDRGDEHDIGVVEAGRELVEQRLKARIAMRLDHGDDAALAGHARRAEHRGNLDRMVRVVVIDGGAVPFADPREAPFHT